jgi:hypothetical protein
MSYGRVGRGEVDGRSSGSKGSVLDTVENVVGDALFPVLHAGKAKLYDGVLLHGPGLPE